MHFREAISLWALPEKTRPFWSGTWASQNTRRTVLTAPHHTPQVFPAVNSHRYIYFLLSTYEFNKTQGILFQGNLDHLVPSLFHCDLEFYTITLSKSGNLPRDNGRTMKGLRSVFSPSNLSSWSLSKQPPHSPLKTPNGLEELLGHNKITILALVTKITIPVIYPECFSHDPKLSHLCTLAHCLKRPIY